MGELCFTTTTGQLKQALFACQEVHFQVPLPASTFAVALCNAFSILLMLKQHVISEFESTLTSESSDPGSLPLSTWSSSTSTCTSGEPAWRLDIVNKYTNIVKRKVYIMAKDPHIGERSMSMRSGVRVQACVSAVSIFV